MSDFLNAMTEASSLQARTARGRRGVAATKAAAEAATPPVPLDMSGSGFDVIAEAKLASPALGRLAAGGSTEQLVDSFARTEAVAISVVTESTRFGGSIEHLESAASRTHLPVMRKDFLVDPFQIYESRAAGASGVLLIARMLNADRLQQMTDLTLSLGMFALVEVFDATDLETASRVFDREILLGINCRDLTTLEVVFDRFEALQPLLPGHLPTIAESGIKTPDDAADVASLGYRGCLVGSALVSADDPESLLAQMISAGRSAKRSVLT